MLRKYNNENNRSNRFTQKNRQYEPTQLGNGQNIRNQGPTTSPDSSGVAFCNSISGKNDNRSIDLEQNENQGPEICLKLNDNNFGVVKSHDKEELVILINTVKLYDQKLI